MSVTQTPGPGRDSFERLRHALAQDRPSPIKRELLALSLLLRSPKPPAPPREPREPRE